MILRIVKVAKSELIANLLASWLNLIGDNLLLIFVKPYTCLIMCHSYCYKVVYLEVMQKMTRASFCWKNYDITANSNVQSEPYDKSLNVFPTCNFEPSSSVV